MNLTEEGIQEGWEDGSEAGKGQVTNAKGLRLMLCTVEPSGRMASEPYLKTAKRKSMFVYPRIT